MNWRCGTKSVCRRSGASGERRIPSSAMRDSRRSAETPLRVAAVLLAAAVALNGSAELAPPPDRAQVEADWLIQDARRLAQPARAVSRESDAAGAVDGVKDGAWGFHTELEQDPWWQVDLGQPTELDRVVIWNRCDPGMAERNSRIKLLASEDGKSFTQLHQHDGTVFFGFTDKRPLSVAVPGTKTRFLRLALAGTSYFHLDEVEVFADGSTNNLALGKPATQSSVSQWSKAHVQPGARQSADYPISLVIERGLKLAASQRRLGASVDAAEQTLREVARQAAAPDLDAHARRALYFRARWAVRELALANPLLSFDSLLFVQRAPGMFPHMSDQHYGWWARGGGGVCVLDGFKSGAPRVRSLTSDLPEGSFMGPDVSFDGKQLLFAYCRFHPELADERNKSDKSRVPEDAFYHVFEMSADGCARRQLTHGKYDDFDARYLPGGEIAFVSTRKGTAIQCSQWFSDSTRDADRPDSYVRCGGDNYRPVPVFTLHGMDADGRNLRPLSAFENFEWTPSVAHDGRLLYTRWDYIDRFNGHFFSLWSANQDGSNPQLVYGNYTVKPQVKIEARAVPGSAKIVFTASAHHSIYGGTLCLLDRAAGTEGNAPLTRLTPEVPFPETEANAEHYFANPWPLSEEYFLVAWSDQKLPPHCRATEEQNPRNATGLYLLDAFGNLELLYRDPALSSCSPMPLAPRVRPPVQASVSSVAQVSQPAVSPTSKSADRGVAQTSAGLEARDTPDLEICATNSNDRAAQATILVQDVYQGLAGISRGAVKHLRLVAVPPKVQPHMNSPSLGVSAEDPGKFVLGTVPVEADGSANFRVPSGVPLFFQALDASGVAVQTMRTLAYAMPGQTLACVGCHEHRESAPPAGAPALAAARAPSLITPGPDGSWPLRFEVLVQPVLNRQCIECHRPDGQDALAAKLDLTPAKSYGTLLAFADGDLRKHAFERDRSLPGEGTAASSKLWKLLSAPTGHAGVKLDADGASRLLTWLDTYAQRSGHYSAEQEEKLAAFRRECAPLLTEGNRR
jgi:hypothetical protein